MNSGTQLRVALRVLDANPELLSKWLWPRTPNGGRSR